MILSKKGNVLIVSGKKSEGRREGITNKEQGLLIVEVGGLIVF
jgi:hypothetical protein